MMRGSPPVVVTLPKFVLANVTFGFPGTTWLNTLNASMRNSIFRAAAIVRLRDRATSTFQYAGPRRYPFGVVPHTPGPFAANASVLNQRSNVRTVRLGSPTMIGR